MSKNPAPAVFLDRDGTLHKDPGYLIRFEDFEPLPGVLEALQLLRDKGYRLFVASNQSGVARGYFTLEAVQHINQQIQAFFHSVGVNLEEIAICPHHPEGSVEPYNRSCECRKPKPGMLLDLAVRHHLDLRRSFMAGDNLRDAEAGVLAGATGVLIPPLGTTKSLDKQGGIKEFESLLEFAGMVPAV